MRGISDRSDWFHRYRWWAAGGAVVLVAVGLVIAFWPAPAPPQARVIPPPRARVYLAYRACLLTGSGGLADPAVAPVWAGMQDASVATRAKVTYLAVAGEQTVGNAVPYANTLVAQHCDAIIAVGQSEVDAVRQAATGSPKTRFYTLGGSPGASNLIVMPAEPAAAVRSLVRDTIKNLVH